ncbi:MAG: dihydroneopterin aldolase [Paracoccaceae bacterium]|nr:dihydroneopterin aldolase [Paracoccaceae bacterium]
MNDDVSLAFAPLVARAKSTGDRDRISLGDYEVGVEIGAFEGERDLIQRLRFNVVVEVAAPSASTNDNVDLILSYDTLTEAINAALAAERLNLLETLADRISELILQNEMAERVYLRIEKLDRGPFRLGVETVRDRDVSRVPEISDAETLGQIDVFFLSESALQHEEVSAVISAKISDKAPVIFCLGMNAAQNLDDMAGTSKMMINLLSINQNAWALASKNPEVAVVETMTELDWSVKNGQAIVWAPAKMVRDAPTPLERPTDGLYLAAWLAHKMYARKLVRVLTNDETADDKPIGADSPVPNIPVETIQLG